MSRSIAAGAYDLQVITNANINMYAEGLATTEATKVAVANIKDAFGTVEHLQHTQ